MFFQIRICREIILLNLVLSKCEILFILDICGEDGVKFDVNILATKTLIVNIQKTPDKRDIVSYDVFYTRECCRISSLLPECHLNNETYQLTLMTNHYLVRIILLAYNIFS